MPKQCNLVNKISWVTARSFYWSTVYSSNMHFLLVNSYLSVCCLLAWM